MQYLLRESKLKFGTDHQLCAPDKEACDLLKVSVTDGPSLVFTRYYEAGKTKIRDHKNGNAAKLCRGVVGCDANALYPSTFLYGMPCGNEKLVKYEDATECVAAIIIENIKENILFDFVK